MTFQSWHKFFEYFPNSVIATVVRRPRGHQSRLSQTTVQELPTNLHFLLPGICSVHQKPFLKFKVLPEKQEISLSA